MNRISMSKLLATVLISFSVSAAWAQKEGQGSNPQWPPWGGGSCTTKECADLEEQKEKRTSCNNKITKMTEQLEKFMSLCKSTGVGASGTDCSKVLDDCVASSSEDTGGILDTVAAQMLGESGSVASSRVNRCSTIAYSDYKSDLRELNREKREIEDKLRDLEDKGIRNAEKKSEGESRIQQEINRAEKEKAESDRKRKDDERNEESQKSNSVNGLKDQLRSINKAILTAQNEQIKLTSVRAQITNEYKAELFNCKLTDEARRNSKDSNQQTKARVSSGLAGSMSRGSNQQNNNSTLLQACLTAAVDKLKARRTAYDAQMRALDEEIASSNERMQEIQQSIALLNQQAAQSKADRTDEQQKQELAHQQAKFIRQKELAEMLQNYQKQNQQTQINIMKTNMAISQSAYRVAEHEKDQPAKYGSGSGKNDRQELSRIQGELQLMSCTNECTGTSLNDKCTNIMTRFKGEGVHSQTGQGTAR